MLKIFCDGGARGNPGPAASAFVVLNSSGQEIYSQGIYLGKATNNQAEYQAVVAAFHWLSSHRPESVSSVAFYLDSELIVRQLTGVYKIKDLTLRQLAQQIHALLIKMNSLSVTFHHIPRSQNSVADALVNATLDAQV